MHVCQLRDQSLCLSAKVLHPLAPGETIRIERLRLSHQRIHGCPLLLCQQLTDRGDVAIRHTKKSQNFMDERFPLRHFSQYMQSHMALAVFEILDIAVKARKIPCEIRLRIRHLTVQICRLRKLTDPWYKPLRRFRFRFLKMRVLIHRLLELRQLLIRPCLFHGCREMIHEAGSAAPLRLDAFPRDRHMVGIDIRQASQSQIGIAPSIEPRAFPRKPFQISMRPDMNDGIRPPHITNPLIVGEILVRRRDERIVIDLLRIEAIAARRLHRKEDMPIHQPRYQDLAFLRRHDRARRFPPVFLHLPLRLFRERREETGVVLSGYLLTRRLLLFGQHRSVIRRLRRQSSDEVLCIFRDEIDEVACFFHTTKQTAHTLDAV